VGSPSETVFSFRYATQVSDAPSLAVSIDMFDLNGNRTSEPLFALDIDNLPPVIVGFEWTDSIAVGNASAIFTFTGEASSDARMSAVLLSTEGEVLANLFVGTTPTGSGLRFSGAVNLETISFDRLSALAAVAVRLTAVDPVGNALVETLSDRPIDVVAPETELRSAPASASDGRDVAFTFSSDEAGTQFQCRFLPEAFEACTSPWTPVLTDNGPHDVEIRAIDAAGNVDETPVQHVFEVMPVWSDLSAGVDAVCGVSTDGRLWCWGQSRAAAGYRGVEALSPIQVSDVRIWRKASISANTACAITRTGEMSCWGNAPVGDGSGVEAITLQPIPGGPWMEVSVSQNHRCALKPDGTLWCWGGAGAGAASGSTPQQLGTQSDWLSVTASGNFSCGLRSNGGATSAWCWGQQSSSNPTLGNGGTDSASLPVEVVVEGGGPASDWLDLSSGNESACGIREVGNGAGSLWCWGHDLQGQDPSPGPLSSARRVGSEDTWTQVSVGSGRACALRLDGSAWCWGGQIAGLEAFRGPNVLVPTAVNNPEPWAKVIAGDDLACGLDLGGALTCWGNNDDGSLGSGETSRDRKGLTPVGRAAPWSDVDAGQEVRCAIAEGELYCWSGRSDGNNTRANDGDTERIHSTPNRVGDASDWVDVSVG
ncbi:MAG: hypothetical protein AAF658_12345, partial [Myxococcota bacterium]